jgi:hypothetical protein
MLKEGLWNFISTFCMCAANLKKVSLAFLCYFGVNVSAWKQEKLTEMKRSEAAFSKKFTGS